MNTLKSNLIATALAGCFIASQGAVAMNDPATEEGEDDRIPTEELVEGIKSRDGRWFEVELIIFQHTGDETQRELFDEEVSNIKPKQYWPLVDEQRKYDVSLLLNTLESCMADDDPLLDNELSFEQFYTKYLAVTERLTGHWYQEQLMCLTPDESLSPYWQMMVNGELNLPQYDVTLPELEMMPQRLTGADYDDFRDVYLIAPQNLQLGEEFDKLSKNKNAKPLLHLGWRQPGLSKRRAMPVYLYGGQNWSSSFYYDGTPTPPEAETELETDDAIDDAVAAVDQGIIEGPNLIEPTATSVAQFMEKLQQGAVVDFKTNKLVFPDTTGLPSETWEFDGYVTVHLNHYLFLDAEFNFREQHSQVVDTAFVLAKDNLLEVDEQAKNINQDVVIQTLAQDSDLTDAQNVVQTNDKLMEIKYLQTYSLKQNRRTYSGDLHYLDHPKLGILFQIRKYRH